MAHREMLGLDGAAEHWSRCAVGRVDDRCVKAAEVLGQLVRHKHDDEDGPFLVLRGRLRIPFEGGVETVLEEGQFRVVPRGTLHNPVADAGCAIAPIETVTTSHTGDAVVPRTRSIAERLFPDTARTAQPATSRPRAQ